MMEHDMQGCKICRTLNDITDHESKDSSIEIVLMVDELSDVLIDDWIHHLYILVSNGKSFDDVHKDLVQEIRTRRELPLNGKWYKVISSAE